MCRTAVKMMKLPLFTGTNKNIANRGTKASIRVALQEQWYFEAAGTARLSLDMSYNVVSKIMPDMKCSFSQDDRPSLQRRQPFLLYMAALGIRSLSSSGKACSAFGRIDTLIVMS